MFMKFIEETVERFKKWRRLNEAAHHYARMGSQHPYSDAIHELHLRSKLEELRDFASDQILADPSRNLEEIKKEWLAATVGPMAKSEFGSNDAKSMNAAVAAMPTSEILHKGALAARMRYVDMEVAKCVTESKARRKLMRV